MNAALGAVSAGGTGTPELEVTHKGGGPWTFVAIQPGRAGGVTLSKFSVIVIRHQQGKHGGGLGVGSPIAIPIPPEPLLRKEADPRWAMASEEPITANTAMQAPMKSNQKKLRNRVDVNIRLELFNSTRAFYRKAAAAVKVIAVWPA
jgi:hypothetical protein